MESEVTLVSIVDETLEKSIELKDLILDLCNLVNKLNSIIYKKGENPDLEWKVNADKFPVVALLDNTANYSGVKFHGVPGWHKLNSFILSIYNLSGPCQKIDTAILNEIKSINKPVNIKIIVSLACHFCPDVVVACQRMAIENKNIEIEMIDLAEFPEIKKDFKIMSVPAIIINNEEIHFAAKKLDKILKLLKTI